MLNRSTKILFINVHLKIGGVERQLIYLLKGLDRKQFKPFLALCEGVGDLLEDVPDDVEVFAYGHPFGQYNIPTFSLWLSKVIKKYQPDLIFSVHGKTNSSAVIASIMSKTPLVVASLPGYVKRGRLYRLHSLILNRSKVIVCVSKGVASGLSNGYLIDIPIKVIPNCVDVNEIISLSKEDVNHPWLKEPRSIPVIISVGRLERGKGFEDIIKAMYIVNKEKKARLLIVGGGSYKKYLIQLVRQYSLQDSVDFVGLQLNPYKFISRADLFVLASISEGLPVTLLESMVLRVPIITTNYAGSPSDIVEHIKNGMVVPPREPRALSSAILLLLQNEKLCSEFKDRGEEVVKARFTVDQFIKNYEELFLSLVK